MSGSETVWNLQHAAGSLIDDIYKFQSYKGLLKRLSGCQPYENVEIAMLRHFALEYWLDGGWYVGRLKEVPGVFSQGETLYELEKNIQDAYKLMIDSVLNSQ